MSAFCYKEPPPANKIFFLNKFYFFQRSLRFPASCFHCLVCISFRNSGIQQGKCSVRTKSKKKRGKERAERNEWKNETSSFSNAEGNSAVKASEGWRKEKKLKTKRRNLSTLDVAVCLHSKHISTTKVYHIQFEVRHNVQKMMTAMMERTNEWANTRTQEEKLTTRRRERERKISN